LFLLKLYHRELPPMELAKLCQRAEHRFAGVKSGLLDPVMSVFGRSGHAIFFDTRTEEVRIVPFPNDLSLIIAESGIERELSDGKYNARREETFAAARALGVNALRDVSFADLERRNDIEPILRRRALHIVGENERVRRAVVLLEQGKAAEFGELMNASHESSRKLFENSTTALDLLVDIAREIPGVLGTRLTGAGFGGATISLCQRSRTDAAVQQLRSGYEKQTGIAPSVFVCEIADGAA
jgi:galactokinase